MQIDIETLKVGDKFEVIYYSAIGSGYFVSEGIHTVIEFDEKIVTMINYDDGLYRNTPRYFYIRNGHEVRSRMVGFHESYLREGKIIDQEPKEQLDDCNQATAIENIEKSKSNLLCDTADSKMHTPRTGSKKQIVAGIIESNPELDKKQLIELIVKTLDVTKANASVYIYNYNKTH